MKAVMLLLMVCFFCSWMTYGQETQLVMTHTAKGKERTIKEAKKIKVYFHDGYIKGKFHPVDSAAIIVGTDTVPLSEITGIEGRTSATLTTGIILAGLGGVALGVGLAAMKETNEDYPNGLYAWTEPSGLFITIAGAGMITYGVGNLVGGKKYKKGKWSFSIR